MLLTQYGLITIFNNIFFFYIYGVYRWINLSTFSLSNHKFLRIASAIYKFICTEKSTRIALVALSSSVYLIRSHWWNKNFLFNLTRANQQSNEMWSVPLYLPYLQFISFSVLLCYNVCSQFWHLHWEVTYTRSGVLFMCSGSVMFSLVRLIFGLE